MKAETLVVLGGYLRERLGVEPKDLHAGKVLVVPHSESLRGFDGAYCLRAGGGCAISVPKRLLETAEHLAGRGTDEVFTVDALRGLFGPLVRRVIGPAWLGYADETSFRRVVERGSRLLGQRDKGALQRLAEACDEVEWEHADIREGAPLVFGCWTDGEIAAAGRLEERGKKLMDVGIITNPACRGRGYARAVVSAMTEYALRRRKVPQVQTLYVNLPALAVAKALGYEQMYSSIALRFDD